MIRAGWRGYPPRPHPGDIAPRFPGPPVPTAYSAAVTVTADAVIHTKGVWTELLAATASDSAGLFVYVSGVQSSGADSRALLDIGFGAAAAETVAIANLPVGGTAAPGVVPGMALHVPIQIPAGTRVSARLQALISADTATVQIATASGDMALAASVIDTIGADTATSTGVGMPTSDTYAEVVAATAADYRALIPVPAWGATTAALGESSLYSLATGAGGSETVVGLINVTTTTGETIGWPGVPPIVLGHFAAGTRIACKQATGRAYRNIIVLGVR